MQNTDTDDGRQALYSGAVRSAQGISYGLVCSHIFGERKESQGISCETNSGFQYVGECHNKMADIMKGENRITADIALVELNPGNCSTDNTVTLDGRQFKLKLKKSPISLGTPVFIIDQNGNKQGGKILYSSFIDRACGLFDVLGITTLDGKQAIHIPGDSGALILSYPRGNEVLVPDEMPTLEVYGMVLGMWINPESNPLLPQTMTIANCLDDVLQIFFPQSNLQLMDDTTHREYTTSIICNMFFLFLYNTAVQMFEQVLGKVCSMIGIIPWELTR